VSASDFFNRWSRRKAGTEQQESPSPAAPVAAESAQSTAHMTVPSSTMDAPEADLAPARRQAPTLADVEQLTPDSDFSSFVAQGVDEDVKRSALKKLFADPHFNRMDGLDTYIDDYSKPDPIPPAMLAALNHAKGLLDTAATDANPEQVQPAVPSAAEAKTATAPDTDPPTDDPHDD
jgi:hypothetical protein